MRSPSPSVKGSQWRAAAKGWALCLPAVCLSLSWQREPVRLSHVLRLQLRLLVLHSVLSLMMLSVHKHVLRWNFQAGSWHHAALMITHSTWCTIATWAWLESPGSGRNHGNWLTESTAYTAEMLELVSSSYHTGCASQPCPCSKANMLCLQLQAQKLWEQFKADTYSKLWWRLGWSF